MNLSALEKVLVDLKTNREKLISNLTEFNRTIEFLETLYGQQKSATIVEDKPAAITINQKSCACGCGNKIENPTSNVQKYIQGHNNKKPQARLSIAESILTAAGESKHNQINLISRASQLSCEGTVVVQIAVVDMLKKGYIHKGDDLIIRNVKDGKILGLPDLSPSELHDAVISRGSRYDKM